MKGASDDDDILSFFPSYDLNFYHKNCSATRHFPGLEREPFLWSFLQSRSQNRMISNLSHTSGIVWTFLKVSRAIHHPKHLGRSKKLDFLAFWSKIWHFSVQIEFFEPNYTKNIENCCFRILQCLSFTLMYFWKVLGKIKVWNFGHFVSSILLFIWRMSQHDNVFFLKGFTVKTKKKTFLLGGKIVFLKNNTKSFEKKKTLSCNLSVPREKNIQIIK